jgi:hypothetical protein
VASSTAADKAKADKADEGSSSAAAQTDGERQLWMFSSDANLPVPEGLVGRWCCGYSS